MATKNKARLADLDMLDDIKQTVDETVRPQRAKKTGRPRLNPHAQDKKLTFRIPEELHRQLRMASADKGRPMTEIVVDALIKHLKKYEAM
jgi:predicted HicB family RNase H-like nuclease